MDDLDLVLPLGIEAQAWATIVNHRDRLSEARQGGDRALTVGRAKELAECVARVVITERGQVAPASASFSSDIDTAHAVLKRQPGTDLSHDPDLRDLVQGAMKMVKAAGKIRNSHGSGHGRPRDPLVEQEMVDAVVGATMLLWVRWALGRLAPLILGQPSSLISDLLGGSNFYTGQLARRLVAANIGDLEAPLQQKLGTAVGIRAMRNTFLVRIEGVEACASSNGLEEWPLPYRRGVVDGLLFDENGTARTTLWAVELLPGLLCAAPNQAAELDRLLQLLGSQRFATSETDWPVWSAAKQVSTRFDQEAQPKWSDFASRFLAEPPY